MESMKKTVGDVETAKCLSTAELSLECMGAIMNRSKVQNKRQSRTYRLDGLENS